MHSRASGVEDLCRLLKVGLAIGACFGKGQRWTRFGAATRITDRRGEISHNENSLMPEILELSQLPQHHSMAQV
jgi:hypothetical protein